MGIRQLFRPEESHNTVEIDQTTSMGATVGGDVTRYTLDTADIIEEIEQKLKGNVWSMRKEKYVNITPPLLNKVGISKILLLLSSYINRNTSLSFFSDDDVRRLAMECRIELARHLAANYKKYDLDQNDYRYIIRVIDSMVYSTLRRAYKGGERENLGQRYKHVQTENPSKSNNRLFNRSGGD